MDHRNEVNKIKNLLIEHSSNTPGFHLAPSLGIIELSIAITEVFDLEKHKIVFDIGHQRYPIMMIVNKKLHGGDYKIPNKESSYNFFLHPTFAGLSTAIALGLCIIGPEKVLLVAGDGAFNSGEIYEGLNHLGCRNSDILIIYNQNDMSIRENIGSLMNKNNLIKFVESFNFEYHGIIDGHDVNSLISILTKLKEKKGRIFLHIRTKKGKGYIHAEKNSLLFHQPFMKFEKETGIFYSPDDLVIKNFFNYFTALQDIGTNYLKNSEDILFTFPSTPPLQSLIQSFPERVIDMGIAEQACITTATSLALSGKRVILPIFATFLSRCFSQIIDLCLSDAPVTIVTYFPGLTPFGIVQQSLHITNMLRTVPNCNIIQVSNIKEFSNSVDFALNIKKPIFIQLPKIDYNTLNPVNKIIYGNGQCIKKGNKLTVLPIGSMFEHVNLIVEKLDNIEIINPRFLKPFDYELLFTSIKKTNKLLILEDAYKAAGLGFEIINIIKNRYPAVSIKWLAAENIFLKDHNYLQAQEFLGISTTKALEAAIELYNL